MSVKSLAQKLLHFKYWKLPNAAVRWFRDRNLRKEIQKRRLEGIIRTLDLNGLRFRFCVNASDAGLSRELLRNDWRETVSTEYLLSTFLKKGEVVLDVGANIGYFATIEACANPENFVYAVEPVLENFEILNFNLLVNKLPNMKTINAAISSEDGMSEILVSEHKNWCTMNKGAAQAISATHAQKVETFTLARFKKEHMNHEPTLLRMDTEGFEYEILMGNKDFLREHKLRLFIEIHPKMLGKQRLIELLTMLKDLGYKVDRWVRNTGYDQHDLVFQPPRFMQPKLGGYGERTISMDELIAESGRWNPDWGPVYDPYILFASMK